MSIQLALISTYLRLFQKPMLARAEDPSKVRDKLERIAARWFRTPPEANVFKDRIEGEAGPIPAEWISWGRPDRRNVLIYLHGGAYLMGSAAVYRHVCAALAKHSGTRVLAPDYRLAPESAYPAAVNDALACYEYLLDAGYEADRIAIAGDSAGGGLSFALLYAAREKGLPDPACIAAFCPWLDMTMEQPSIKRNARKDPLLPASRFEDVRNFYLQGADHTNPTASPLLADLQNPPPVLLQGSRIELLEDEIGAMADKLRESGGDVRLEWWRKAPHSWHLYSGMAPEADDALRRAGRFILSKLPQTPIDEER
ncbi:MAG: alpha/beta hydrolase [Pikeienuella sp.]